MPNWVNNDLRITSEKPERIKAIREKLFTVYHGKEWVGCDGKEYLSYAVLVPEDKNDPNYRVKPENANIEAEDKRADGTIFDWYQFRLDKWGCKWDVSPEECEITEDTDRNICVSFTSPWDCPCEWYKALCEAFPDVSIELVAMDEAMDYYWENGKLGKISEQIDENQAKRDEIERVFNDNGLSLDDYNIEKIIENYEDGYFEYFDMFDPDTWEFTISDEEEFIDFCKPYKKKKLEKHNVIVRFKDSDEEEEQCIAIGTYDEKTVSEEEDNTIFFYAENKNVYKKLFNEDNGEDFVVVKEI